MKSWVPISFKSLHKKVSFPVILVCVVLGTVWRFPSTVWFAESCGDHFLQLPPLLLYLYISVTNAKGFIHGRALGILTACERDLAINLPSCFCVLLLLSFIRKTKNARLKNPTDLLHKNLMKPLGNLLTFQAPNLH